MKESKRNRRLRLTHLPLMSGESRAFPHDLLSALLMQLPESERLVLLLHDVALLNAHEIAAELAISPFMTSLFYKSGWKRLRKGLSSAAVDLPEENRKRELQYAICDTCAFPKGAIERFLRRFEHYP